MEEKVQQVQAVAGARLMVTLAQSRAQSHDFTHHSTSPPLYVCMFSSSCCGVQVVVTFGSLHKCAGSQLECLLLVHLQ